MRVLVCGAAPEPGGDAHYRALLAGVDRVVAADAGAEWAVALDRVPDLAVGDFDSAVPGAADRLRALGVEVLAYSRAKDYSDLDLAVSAAREQGADTLTFTAVSSLRLDHTLAALGTLARAADLRSALDEPSVAGWALDADSRPEIGLAGPPGAIVSVFALGAEAGGVTLGGMRFPLTAARLDPLSSHGLSNELRGGPASVTVRSGRLLVLSPGMPSARARLV